MFVQGKEGVAGPSALGLNTSVMPACHAMAAGASEHVLASKSHESSSDQQFCAEHSALGEYAENMLE